MPNTPGVNATLALEKPGIAVPMMGVAGIVPGTFGVTELEAADHALVPMVVVVLTVQVYAVPLTNPVTRMGELLPVAVVPPQLAV
jgi:hypothetical protein